MWPSPFGCACDAAIWRTVFGTEQLQGAGQRVVACMRCGRTGAVVSKTSAIEGDPHDAVRVVGLEALTVAPSDLAWLGAWPRLVGDPERFEARSEDVFFLPASARFESELDLERAEGGARDAAAKRFDERLRAAGVPLEAPPASPLVRERFWFFAEAWESLRLPAETSIEALLERADPLRRPASWVAEARLPTGDRLAHVIAALIGDPDVKRRRAGLSALNMLKARSAGTFTLPDAIVDAATSRIAQLDPADDSRRYLIAVLGAFDALAAARWAR